ncbi:MAG: alpha/beta hydrolase [Actinobacteria bacterium]|nr:alpha/beta hydrolase [Actinomycetota bacterium]
MPLDDASPTIPPSSYVDLDGPVHYREWEGPDDLTIVCVHALGRNHLSWIGPSPALSRHARLLALDLPGYGLSPRDGRHGTVEAQQSLLDRFLDTTTTGRVVLVGESLGGAVSARQAGRDPERIAGVVLISSYLPPVFGGWRAPVVVSGLLLERAGELGRLLVDVPLNAIVPRVGEVPLSEEVAKEESAIQRECPRGLRGLLTDGEALASLVHMSAVVSRAHAMFDAIHCPVLILHGEVDSEVPVAWARATAVAHPGWELHVLREVGHICDLDDPGAWADLATDWLVRAVMSRPRHGVDA